MAEHSFEERKFVKTDGDQTLTRRVTNPTSEVQARFDGYLPEEETAPAGEVETTAGTAQPPPSTAPTRTSGPKPAAPGSSPS